MTYIGTETLDSAIDIAKTIGTQFFNPENENTQRLGRGLKTTGQVLGESWQDTREFKEWYNLPGNLAAVGARGIEATGAVVSNVIGKPVAGIARDKLNLDPRIAGAIALASEIALTAGTAKVGQIAKARVGQYVDDAYGLFSATGMGTGAHGAGKYIPKHNRTTMKLKNALVEVDDVAAAKKLAKERGMTTQQFLEQSEDILEGGLLSNKVDDVLGAIPVKSNAADEIGEMVRKAEAARKAKLISEGHIKFKPKDVVLDSAEAMENFYGMKQIEMRQKFGFRFKNKSSGNKKTWGLESVELGKQQLKRRTERILEVTESDQMSRGLEKIKAIQAKGQDPHHIVPTHISKKIKDSLSQKEWELLVKADATRGIYHGNHPRNLVAARHSTKTPTTTAGKKSEIFHRRGNPEEALTGYHTLERQVASVKDYHQYRDLMANQMKLKRQATKFIEDPEALDLAIKRLESMGL